MSKNQFRKSARSNNLADISALVREAVPHLKGFFGVSDDYHYPQIAIDQGQSVTREKRSCYDSKADVMCFPSNLDQRNAIRIVGHEVSHWLHYHTNTNLRDLKYLEMLVEE